jgi:hypothetical protein
MVRLGFAFALVGALAGCGGAENMTSFPTLKLTKPATGATVKYDMTNTDVNIEFTVTGLMLMDPGKCGTTANCGHVEFFIDGTTCNDHSDPMHPQPYNDVASASPATAGLDYCPMFPNVNGMHTLKAELHKDDLSAIDGASGAVVSDSVTFTAGM